jgi:hypothetical protein
MLSFVRLWDSFSIPYDKLLQFLYKQVQRFKSFTGTFIIDLILNFKKNYHDSFLDLESFRRKNRKRKICKAGNDFIL